MASALLWLAIWSGVLYAVGWLAGGLPRKRWVKIVAFPGFIAEALLRGIAALATGTPVQKASPFGQDRPFLTLGPTPVRHLGPALNLGLRLALVFVATHGALLEFPIFLKSGFSLPLLTDVEVDRDSAQWGSFGEFVNGLESLPRQIEWGTLYTSVLLYTLATALLASGLNFREFITALYAWGGLFVVTLVTSYLGVSFGFLSRGWFAQLLYGRAFWSSYSLLFVMTLLTLGALALLRVGLFVAQHVRTSRKSSGGKE